MYVSIDIETGGLNFSTDILQVAAVKWNHEDINQCSYIDFVIKQPQLIVEPFAARMNASIIADMVETSGKCVDGYDEAWATLGGWLGDEKVFAIGKNASMFDLPFMTLKGFPIGKHFHHRVLDAGSLYATCTGIPNLTQILGQIKTPCPVEGVLHDALYDARVTLWAVQEALRE